MFNHLGASVERAGAVCKASEAAMAAARTLQALQRLFQDLLDAFISAASCAACV